MHIKNVENGVRMRKLWISEVRGTKPGTVSEFTTWTLCSRREFWDLTFRSCQTQVDEWRMQWRSIPTTWALKLTTWTLKSHPINRNQGSADFGCSSLALSLPIPSLSPILTPRSPGINPETRSTEDPENKRVSEPKLCPREAGVWSDLGFTEEYYS